MKKKCKDCQFLEIDDESLNKSWCRALEVYMHPNAEMYEFCWKQKTDE